MQSMYFPSWLSCMSYHCRKWTDKSSSNPWRTCLYFTVLIPLGMVWVQLFSLQWVNHWADWLLSLGMVTSLKKENSEEKGTTPFLRLLHFTLDMYLIMLSVKQGDIKYHFLSLWYDSTWDWTSVSRAIGEHSTQ